MTSRTNPAPPLLWEHAVEDIPRAGLATSRSASTEERQRVASLLDLAGCSALDADYRITPLAGGRFQLSGRLRGAVTQTCVVTLEPIDNAIAENFAAVFWPQEDMAEPEGGEMVMDDEPEREAILAGKIAVGRVVFESLAAALDPFPRKPEATLDWQPAPPQSDSDKPDSPFSVLANLKTKR